MSAIDTTDPKRLISAYIGLGANLGQAAITLRHAMRQLEALPQVRRVNYSRFYTSAPIESSGPDYVNAVAHIQTTLTAHELLRALQAIEQAHGRERPYRNAPRTLDLDLLLYGQEHINEPDLVVPHPRMHERAFVLAPLAELFPMLALNGQPIQQLLAGCAHQRIYPIN